LITVLFCSVCLLGGCDSVSYLTSTSGSLQKDLQITPTLVVTTSGTPSSFGGAVTFTATVSNGPTGTVTFYDSGSPVGIGTLSGTTATFTTNALAIGAHAITASWAGDRQYTPVTSSSIAQTVNQAIPAITWPIPAAITYGTELTATQLDATSTVSGSFSYSPTLGTVLAAGPQTLSETFTPTDTTDYSTATTTVSLTVNKATPPITWATPMPITYGTAVSATQLNASSSVPGTFAYSPALGTVLNPGSQTLSLEFTPTDNTDYSTAVARISLLVDTPSVTVPTPSTPILAGTTYPFTAIVTGISNQALQWAVDSIVGGSSQAGTITATGLYTAPANTNEAVIISATLQAYPAIQGSAQAQVIGPTSSPGQIGFAFSLPTSAATSAGVYDSQGRLLRTLWSNQSYPAGPQVANWDGKDDFGTPLAAGSYQMRVLFNNVTYNWGVIGNTSANWLGPNIWDTQSNLPTDMAIVGTTAYVADSYAEERPNASFFDLSQPQTPASLFQISQCIQMQMVATDGKLLYFANTGNGWSGSSAFVMAFDPTALQPYNFPAGASAAAESSPSYDCGSNYLSGVIDYAPTTSTNNGVSRTNIPTGIAVQTTGNLLAVSHGASSTWPSEDIIRLFDKTSGALRGSIIISNPQRLAFASNGDLWAISGNSVVLISSVGNQNIVTLPLQGLSAPLAIAVDSSTNDLLVADGGQAQQVKRFSSGGQLLSTYGNLGGYTDCDPTVTKSRLFLDATAGSGYTTTTFLAIQSDSSFWVSDPGNARVLHISSQGQYIEQISFLRYLYHIAVDHNNPSRVFADLLEYSVDYTKPLTPGDPDPKVGGNGSWSLVKNWYVCVPSKYYAFYSVQTFGNGRTYGESPNLDRRDVSNYPLPELVELPESGPLRFSGQVPQYNSFAEFFDHEGNLAYWMIQQNAGSQVQLGYRQVLIGYDSNAWPSWGTPQLLASVPYSAPWASPVNDPDGYQDWGMTAFPEATDGGIFATLNPDPATPGIDHHLGGVAAGGTDWSWKASPGAMLSTPDGKGTFTDVDNFGGHNGIAALVEGSNIFEGYDGQYGSFSSQWMHWSEDGLLIGQFGHPANGAVTGGTLYPGAAGNIGTMATVMAGNNIYLYNSDEGYHPGIHRWTISGLDTIREVSGSAQLGGTVALQ
jgi:hypothetical protein